LPPNFNAKPQEQGVSFKQNSPSAEKISPVELQISGVQGAAGQRQGPVAKPMGNPNLNLAATVVAPPHCFSANPGWLLEALGCPQEFPG
jgi:hypothetical protein